MDFSLAAYVDLQKYPIDRPASAAYAALLDGARAMLAADGCAVLPGFVHADGVRVLAQEADAVAPQAWRSFSRTNPYFTRDDDRLPPVHPLRRFYRRSNAFVPADNFSADSPLRRLYEHPALMPFARDALEEEEFYRYADPLADVIINVVEPGDDPEDGGFPWHFDTNAYTVTLAVQNGEAGGVFEYAPRLRSSDSENYDEVQEVLDGRSRRVKQLHLQPGDLQIFRGRHALHRVTGVTGGKPRYVAIFSFAAIPDMVASPERCKQLYGRVLPVHLARERTRHDALRD